MCLVPYFRHVTLLWYEWPTDFSVAVIKRNYESLCSRNEALSDVEESEIHYKALSQNCEKQLLALLYLSFCPAVSHHESIWFLLHGFS
jgi:hypothetical protein